MADDGNGEAWGRAGHALEFVGFWLKIEYNQYLMYFVVT